MFIPLRPLRLFRRLLLCKAVEGSEPPDKVYGVYAYYGAVCEQLCKHAERQPVVGVIKGRNEHGGIRYIEIRIACGQTLSVEIKRRRHRQRHNIDP